MTTEILRRATTRLALCLSTAAALATAAEATVWFVQELAPPGGDGVAWATAFDSLDSALAVAGDGDQIWVSAGTYRPADPVTGFLIEQDVLIFGGFRGNEATLADRRGLFDLTRLDGDLGVPGDPTDNAQHVISIPHPPGASVVVLDGFTILNGNAGLGDGGGIRFEADHLFLSNCTFLRNDADRGGAIYAEGHAVPIGPPQLAPSTTAQMTIRSCRFSRNTAARGGAIFGNLSQSTVWNSVFHLNATTGAGGAIFLINQPSLAFHEFANCVFTKNSATLGGAVRLAGPASVAGGRGRWTNCTFAFNVATTSGGAIDATSQTTLPSGPASVVENSILWGNSAPVGAQLEGEHDVSWSDVEGGWAGPGNFAADPLFANPATGRLDLRAGSPAIDAANSALLPTDQVDLDGDAIVAEALPVDFALRPRTVDDPATADTGVGPVSHLDVGAFERP